MTQAEFFAWDPPGDRRHEFDGFAPVPMTGGTRAHNRICQNLWAALRGRLRGGTCEVLGPDAGLATVGDAVRYPDALVTCTGGSLSARLIPDVVVVFEVVSQHSDRTDRIVKLREYRAVPSIRRYVLLQSGGIGLTVLQRAPGAFDWTASSLLADDTLRMPEIGIEVPVAELYDGMEFAKDGHWPYDGDRPAED